jgi:hypothetical protein
VAIGSLGRSSASLSRLDLSSAGLSRPYSLAQREPAPRRRRGEPNPAARRARSGVPMCWIARVRAILQRRLLLSSRRTSPAGSIVWLWLLEIKKLRGKKVET